MQKQHAAIIIKSQAVSIIEDSYLLAALLTFDPSIKYVPLVDANGDVVFEVEGAIADSMGLLYAGETAPLTAYISNLKGLRSAIFALRSRCRNRKAIAKRNGAGS